MNTYCVPGSLHIYSPFLIPSSFLFSPPPPRLSGLSALFQDKEQTFTEHLWYDNQLPVLSLLSSHPPISLTCGLCYPLLSALCQGMKWAFIEHLLYANLLTLPSPSILPVPSFLLHLLFLGETGNYGAPTVCQAINIPSHLLLPLSPGPSPSASFSLPCVP